MHTKVTRPDARASTGAARLQTSGADGFGVGSHITSARPIHSTADRHEIDGRRVAKRDRIAGITPSPRVTRVL